MDSCGREGKRNEGKEASLGRKTSRGPEVLTETSVDSPGSSEDELTLQSFPESHLGPLYPHIESVIWL